MQGSLTKGLYLKSRVSEIRINLDKLGSDKKYLENFLAVPIDDRRIGRNNNKFNSIRDSKIQTRTKENCTVSKPSVRIKHKGVNNKIYPFSYKFNVAGKVDLNREKLAHRTAKLEEIPQYFIELWNTEIKN